MLLVLSGVVDLPVPSYDSLWSLAWGRELADGSLPDITVDGAPTQHPLAILFAALLELLTGASEQSFRPAELWMVACVVCAALALVATYRITVALTGMRTIGALAAILVLTRKGIADVAALGLVDIAHLALCLMSAEVLIRRRAAGATTALLFLALAGLLRPEAWLLSLIVMVVVHRNGSSSPWQFVLAIAAPLGWLASDLILTGNPFFSFTHTAGLADELRRDSGLWDLIRVGPVRFRDTIGGLVLVLGFVGLIRFRSNANGRLLMVIGACVLASACLPMGVGTSILSRYFVLAGAIWCIFAAAAVVPPATASRRATRVLVLAAVSLAILAGIADLLRVIDRAMAPRETERALASILASPAADGARTITIHDYKTIAVGVGLARLPRSRFIPGNGGEVAVLPRSARISHRFGTAFALAVDRVGCVTATNEYWEVVSRRVGGACIE